MLGKRRCPFFITKKLMEQIEKAKNKNSNSVKTYVRSATILPEMVNMTFQVHNGKSFIAVKVTDLMIGHKLGEFAETRKLARHTSKNKEEKSGKQKPKQKQKK